MSEDLRLDKWLWQARFAKTRSLAARLVETGAARINGRRVKPHFGVRVGSRITIRIGHVDRLVEVRALGTRRGPAAEARLLYDEAMPAVAVAPADWRPLIDEEI
jgi:ribosome-associated heat shock protein Hsp15